MSGPDLLPTKFEGPSQDDPDATRRGEAPPLDRSREDLSVPRMLLGRYLMVRKLGSGGGGVVHVAYDPELDRKVAIKLLHAGSDGSSGSSRPDARLLREAQAMARLSHPNVIAVYDVGTYGTSLTVDGDHAPSEEVDRGVYVVMELVVGSRLDTWMAEPHPWREIVRVFLQAARGIAAAHEQGLVHRDFKPSNVIVGEDGRVRVLDFGLARALAGRASPSEGVTARPADSEARLGPERPHGSTLDTPLTMDGTVMGTPAYMAPEQHRGDETDDRTDQYAFCVALYEALHGIRPFPGIELAALRSSKETMALQRGPRTPPRWLAETVLRGLQPDPADRFPDMRELISRLQYDPVKRVKRWLLVGGLAMAGGALAFGVYASRTATEQVCTEQTHAFDGIWDLDAREAIRTAFVNTGVPYADTTFDSVRTRLDRAKHEWLDVRQSACKATLVDQTQSMSTMGAQMQCLDRSLARMGGLSQTLAKADTSIVKSAVDAVSSLPDPGRCASVGTHAQKILDERERAEVFRYESRLAEAAADLRVAHYDQAESRARGLVTELETGGDDRLLASAYGILGRVRAQMSDAEGAE